MTDDGLTCRGAVLFADFEDIRDGVALAAPLQFAECRDLVAATERSNGIVVETTSRRLVAFFSRVPEALAMGRGVLDVIGRAHVDPARRTLAARVLLTFGTVTLKDGRMRGDWTAALPDQVRRVPANAVAARKSFVDELDPADVQNTLRPYGTELFLLARGPGVG